MDLMLRFLGVSCLVMGVALFAQDDNRNTEAGIFTIAGAALTAASYVVPASAPADNSMTDDVDPLAPSYRWAVTFEAGSNGRDH